MLKTGTKRRTTTTQVAADKEEAAIKEVAIQERLEKIRRMEAEAESNKNAAEILREFMSQGVAIQDENGKISIPSASKIKPPTK